MPPDSQRSLVGHGTRATWPWWRLLCAALVPWSTACIVASFGAPTWAVVGFGMTIGVVALVGAAIRDAVVMVQEHPPEVER